MEPCLRRSTEADIPALHRIRLSVRENRLTDPSRLTEADYRPYIKGRGETWQAMIGEEIAGFAALDHTDRSIWALFVDPAFEGNGHGKRLMAKLIDQARALNLPDISLVTSLGTRAENFYRHSGWQADGLTDNGECRLTLKLD